MQLLYKGAGFSVDCIISRRREDLAALSTMEKHTHHEIVKLSWIKTEKSVSCSKRGQSFYGSVQRMWILTIIRHGSTQPW